MSKSGGGAGVAEPCPPADEERLAALFQRLDTDKDGRIGVEELRVGIHRMGLPHDSGTAEVRGCTDYTRTANYYM